MNSDGICDDASNPWLNSRAAALRLGCSHKHLERLSRKGEVPAYKKLNRWFYLRSELDAWIKAGFCLDSHAANSVREN